ncbi:hypothetical protein PPNK14_25870 [Pectobacterium parmentieri]
MWKTLPADLAKMTYDGDGEEMNRGNNVDDWLTIVQLHIIIVINTQEISSSI